MGKHEEKRPSFAATAYTYDTARYFVPLDMPGLKYKKPNCDIYHK